MSSSTLYRLSGIALLIGGLLATIGILVEGFNENLLSPIWLPAGLLLMIGEMFFTLGLPGLYTRQAREVGIVGLIGFVLFFFSALLFGVVTSTLYTFIFPWLTQSAPKLGIDGPPALGLLFAVSGLMSLIGSLLLGVATIRAGILSRGAAILFLAASVLNIVVSFFPLPYANSIVLALLFISLAWFGTSLLTKRNQEVAALSPVTPLDSIRV